MSTAKFQLGQPVMTQGAAAALEEAHQQPFGYLQRHVTGDWGELDEHDRQENEFSLTRNLHLLSAYTLTNGTHIWIITEADRSATTILCLKNISCARCESIACYTKAFGTSPSMFHWLFCYLIVQWFCSLIYR